MSATGTQSTTFTAVDIRKVVDNFAADFSMIAQATGLRSRDSIAHDIADLKIFAEKKYLVRVTLILENAAREQIRGARYEVSQAATGWTSDRPGNNLWPKTPNGSLQVIATMSQAWWDKSDQAKKDFIAANGIHGSWEVSTKDVSLSSLNRVQGQKYASNGYGWERVNFA